MDRQRYIDEGYRQLIDTSVYLWINATAISDIEEEIRHLADQLHIERATTDDIRQFAISRDTKPARFYLLPKVYKRCARQTSYFCVRFSHKGNVRNSGLFPSTVHADDAFNYQ